MKQSASLAVYPLSTDIELSPRVETKNRFVDNLPSVIAPSESSRLKRVCLDVADSDDGLFSTSSGVKLGCDVIAIVSCSPLELSRLIVPNLYTVYYRLQFIG